MELPETLVHLYQLKELQLVDNPLNPELDAAYSEGLDAVKRYLRAKAEAQVVLNEAKLSWSVKARWGRAACLGRCVVIDEKGTCKGINELKDAIAKVAASLPEVGRAVPKRWQEVREALRQTGEAYLPLDQVLAICAKLKMSDQEAQDFVRISHRLDHLIHYGHDPRLKEMVILKPDWLATAVSFVLDDEETRNKHGLVKFTRLGKSWSDNERAEEFRYPPRVHPIFVALMERFDLSYRVAGSPLGGQEEETLATTCGSTRTRVLAICVRF